MVQSCCDSLHKYGHPTIINPDVMKPYTHKAYEAPKNTLQPSNDKTLKYVLPVHAAELP